MVDAGLPLDEVIRRSSFSSVEISATEILRQVHTQPAKGRKGGCRLSNKFACTSLVRRYFGDGERMERGNVDGWKKDSYTLRKHVST